MKQINDYLGSFSIELDEAFPLDRFVLENGAWEPHIVQLINSFTRPGDICIDVGANAGYHTLAMAGAVGVHGRVFAFEPNEITYPKLLKNLSLNPVFNQRITCVQAGLSNKEGEMRVYQAGDEPGNAYVSDSVNETLWTIGGEENFTICTVMRLDSFLEDKLVSTSTVGLIKVDVEGMELEVLQGSEQTLSRFHPTVLFETALEYFDHDKIRACENYLRSMGYEIMGIDGDTGKLTPVTYPNLGIDSVAIHPTRTPL